ncbi:MAG: PAS domain S-box protein [Burkholderiales bacterium]
MPQQSLSRPSLRLLLALVALAAVLPLAGILAWQTVARSRDASENAFDHAAIIAANTASSLDRTLARYGSLLEQVARRPVIRALDPARCDPFIPEFISVRPEFTTLAVRDTQGRAVCSFLPAPIPTLDPEGFPWFTEGLRSPGFVAGDAFLGQQTDKWVSVLTHPVRGDAGGAAGLLVMPLELRALAARTLGPIPEGLVVTVTDRGNRVLLRSRDQDAWVGKALPGHLPERARGQREGRLEGNDAAGARQFYAFASVPATGWRVWAQIPEGAIAAVYRDQLLANSLLAGATLLLAVAGAWWVASFVLRPVDGLAKTASRVAGGEASARAPTGGPREVDAVARQFNRMLDALERHRAERRAVAGHYDQLLEAARDIILLIAPDGRIVEANGAALAAYGYTREELLDKHMLQLRAPVDEATLQAQLQAADSPGGVLFETEHVRKDGSRFPVEVSARTIAIDGRTYRQSFVRDVTARKQAEAQAAGWMSRFQAAILASRQLLHEWDPATGEMTITGDTARILGYGAGEMQGGLARWRELIHPEDLPAFDRGLARAVATGESFHQGYRVLHRDGTWVPMQDDGYFVHDADGRISGMVCFVVDVSAQERAHEEASRQLEELRRWHAAMLGRESRILALKREVNELLAAAGEPPRYGDGETVEEKEGA